MLEYFSVKYIIFELLGYKVSLIEFISVLFGLWSVWLAVKKNIHTWTTGIINILGFFIIFKATLLYSSALLQIFYFIATIYGLYKWNKKNKVEISDISLNEKKVIIIHGSIISVLVGYIMGKMGATTPYYDAYIAVMSVFATYLMAYKKIYCWILWSVVNVISIILYFYKGLPLIAILYIIFLVLSIKGFAEWFGFLLNIKNNEKK